MNKIYLGDLNTEITDLLPNDNKVIIITERAHKIKREINKNNVFVYNLFDFITNIYHKSVFDKEIISHNFQKLLFLKAIKKSTLKYLNKYDTEIVDDFINIYHSEVMNKLSKTSYKTNVIDDIEVIIFEYKKLLGDKYIDLEGVYLEVLNILDNYNAFDNIKIYIDSIYDYSDLELNLIYKLSKKNKLKVLLLDSELYNLDIVKNKNNYLINLFNDNYKIIKLGNENEINNLISQNIYSTNSVKTLSIPDISIYGAADLYNEVEHVVNSLKKEIFNHNFKYHEIAITGPNIKDYENYIKLLFKEQGIPFRKSEEFNKTLYDFIINLFDIISSEISNWNLLQLLKTGYFNVNDFWVNRYQEYIYEYELKDEPLDLSIFKNDQNLREIKLILDSLYDLTEVNTTADFLKELYLYLTNIQLINKLNGFNDDWNHLIDLIDYVYEIFEQETLDLNFMKKIFILLLGDKRLNNNVNEVFVGDLNEVYQRRFKLIFVLGMNDDQIPAPILQNTLIGSTEKNKYYKEYPLFEVMQQQELYLLSSLITSTHHTYWSYPKVGSDNRLKSPARVINRLMEIFPNFKEDNNYILEERFTTNKSLLRSYNHLPNKSTKKLIYDYYLNHSIYKDYIKRNDYFNNLTDVTSISPNLINKWVGKEIYLSPSRIDTYYQNPFNYFCKYILRLEPTRKRKFDNLLVGNYIHYLLEKTISMNNDHLEYDCFMELMNAYILENDINKLRVKYLLEKITQNNYYLYSLIQKQLKLIKYTPSLFETSLLDNRFSRYSFKVDDVTIYMNGIIDRIDVLNNNALIIDYKTGSKKLDLNQILYGINTQLFIYSMFIDEVTNYKSNGVFYMPSYVKFDEDIKSYRLTGMFINSEENISKLGGDDINLVVDAKSYNKLKKSVAIKEEDLALIYKFIKKKINEMILNILDGDFKVKPIDFTKDYDDPYRVISGIDSRYQNYRKLDKYSYEDVLAKMKEEVE